MLCIYTKIVMRNNPKVANGNIRPIDTIHPEEKVNGPTDLIGALMESTRRFRGSNQAINAALIIPAIRTTPEPIIWSMTSRKGFPPIVNPCEVKLNAEGIPKAVRITMATKADLLRDMLNSSRIGAKTTVIPPTHDVNAATNSNI